CEDAILYRCRHEYPRHVRAERHGFVIAGDVRIVSIIGVRIIVTPCAEWLGGYHCEGIPSLINGGAAKSPTSSKNSARTMSAVQSRYFVIKGEGEAVRNVPGRITVELVRVQRRRIRT